MDTEPLIHRNAAPGTIWVFFALAALLSWAIWVPMFLLVPADRQLPLLLLGGFSPFLSAVVLIWAREGKTALKQWLRETFRVRINPVWYLVGGLFLPIAMALLHHSAYILAGGVSAFTFNQTWGIYIARLVSTALLGGGNEEPGWRGYATPRLMVRFHPIVANFIVGIFWVIWHIPLYLGSWSGKNQPLMWFFIYAVGLSIVMTWLYFKSGKSVLPVMLLHAGTNIVFDFVPRTNTIFSSPSVDFNVFKSIAYWCVAIVIIVMTKGRLGYSTETGGRRSN
jgi:membrane protease YdiL (CAAX protease family)